jgi:serine protease Do
VPFARIFLHTTDFPRAKRLRLSRNRSYKWDIRSLGRGNHVLKNVVLMGILAGFGLGVSGCGNAVTDGSGNYAYLDIENVTKRARDMVYPATVRVEARKTEYFGGQKKRIGGNGSGVIFDPEGHVLTNYHVAGRAQELSCTLYNKERVKAKLIGGDPWTDLAVIQLDLDEVRQKGIELQWAPFGNSDHLSEGEKVLAIGSPFGLSRSISSGIVSCHDRILSKAMKLGGGLETGLFNTWIQTDAAINPGNSGGPLVNMQGEVVGINTRGGGNDLGFAVPINVAKDVVRQILEHGKVLRSNIGVTFQPLQDLEEFFEVSKTEGAVIASVDSASPAEAAGLQPQDILMTYGGKKVMGRYPEELFELRRMIADTPVGDEVTLTIKRNGQQKSLTLTTAELTTVRSDEVNFGKWGFVGQNITKRLATRKNLKDTVGVFLTGVRNGEPAAKAQLVAGDIVIRFGQKDVADSTSLKKLYGRSVKNKDKMVLLMIRRGPSILPRLLKISYDEGDETKATDAKDTETEQDDKAADK